jgi:hypothetical protein
MKAEVKLNSVYNIAYIHKYQSPDQPATDQLIN